MSEAPSRVPTALLGWAGAALFGLAEVVDVAHGGRLGPSAPSVAVLAILAIVVTGASGAIAAFVLDFIPQLRRQPRDWAFLVGVATPIIASGAIAWFSDPPPLQAAWPGQGNPLVWLIVGVGGPAIAVAGLAVAASRARPIVYGALIVAALVAGGGRGPPAAAPLPDGPHPNVLLVTLDTARADRFGASRIDTAAFDRIASEGVKFDAAFAQIPVTGPSHATILLGEGPWDHGNLLNGRHLPTDRPMLAEVLRERGYATAAFVSAWVLDGDLGFARGFDVYDDDFRWVTGLGRTVPGRLFEMGVRNQDGTAYLAERRGDLTVDRALDWLDANHTGERPFFLWVHLFDPHGAYRPPPPYDMRYYEGDDPRDPADRSMARVRDVPPYLAPSLVGITDVDWVIAQYDGEVAFADAQFGRLVTALDDLGVAKDTLVIVAGDHGEGLGEAGEWFTHGDHLYAHDLHVPLAMRLPGVLPPDKTVDHPVELADVAPTVLSLVGFPAIPSHTGVDLRAAIVSDRRPHPVARAVCLDRDANGALRRADPIARPAFRRAAVHDPDEHLVVSEATPGEARYWLHGVERPFRPVVDPHVPDPSAAEAQRAREQLERQARALVDRPAGEVAPLDEATRQMLERLGYIEE